MVELSGGSPGAGRSPPFLQECRTGGVPRNILVEEFIEALPQSSLPTAVLSSLQGSLLDQVVGRLAPGVQKVDIVTPINGDPSALVRKLVAATGTRDISLFTSEEPVPLVPGVKAYHTLERPGENDGEGLRAVYRVHAKLFAFLIAGGSVDLFWAAQTELFWPGWLAGSGRMWKCSCTPA